MKLELEWDESRYRVGSIWFPDPIVDPRRGNRLRPDFHIWVGNLSGLYIGTVGTGPTAQAALDHAIKQIDNYSAERANRKPAPLAMPDFGDI